uniref:Secreted protein n=1 Tax=Rhizophora mucronata TaxID=61149 RepID=A0A2P2K848_RHIMU
MLGLPFCFSFKASFLWLHCLPTRLTERRGLFRDGNKEMRGRRRRKATTSKMTEKGLWWVDGRKYNQGTKTFFHNLSID